MKDTELKAIREEKRKAIDRQDKESKQEWTERELAWLEEHIERAPQNVKRMRSLLALLKQEERQAKREGNFAKVEEYREKEEALERRILVLQPENQIIRRELERRIQKRLQGAVAGGDTVEIAKYEAQRKALEQPKPNPEEERKQAFAKARSLIYEKEDIIQVAEEIKGLMEGAEPTELNFLLAELYFHTGFQQRAQKFLKAYKRELSESGKSVKLVNLGLGVVLNSRSNKFSWDEFWRRKAELEKVVEHGEEEK